MSDNDSFDDDDDFDLDKVYDNAQATQKLQQSQIIAPIRNSINASLPQEVETNKKRPLNGSSNKEDIYQVKGENSILRGQIEKLHKERQDSQKRLKEEFEKLLKEKVSSIEALNETIYKIKSENEFLVSENKNLCQENSRKRKLKTSDHNNNNNHHNHGDIEFQSQLQADITANSTSNTSNVTDSTANISNIYQTPITTSVDNISSPEIKVVIMNQATFFQDEKTLFLEAISNYVIPGMPHSTLHYLENISSSFNFTSSNNFTIKEDQESFKSVILKYLINFQDKNRIDYLLSSFINVLMDYLEETFKKDSNNSTIQLLPIPFLLSLINFALNYRPKAINDIFIGKITKMIILFIKKFQDIFKPEFEYLALPDSNQMLKYVLIQNQENNEIIDYSFIEKPMHVKILEVFTSLFLMDTLTTLSKIASFHIFSFNNSKANSIFWKEIPDQFLFNSFLSTKSPISFIYNTLEILINSFTDDDKFAYDNVQNKKLTKQKEVSESSGRLLGQFMIFLTSIKTSQIHYNIYGLNKQIGSNRHLKLLDMMSIPSDKLSSNPSTNSFDNYKEVLKIKSEDFIKQEYYLLSTKMKILELFEIFYSVLIMQNLPSPPKASTQTTSGLSVQNKTQKNKMYTTKKLVNVLSKLIGEEQEILFRNVRSSNNKFRIDLISKAVTLLHHLITKYIITMTDIGNPTLREMIIVLLRISAKSMKNESINYIEKIRRSGYILTLFNSEQEMKELDKFGIWNSIISFDKLSIEDKDKTIENRIHVEIDLYNGIEFNYSDETIDLARDIVSMSVTGDEADRLHDSINYIDDEEDEDFMMLAN
ncbi:lethal, checkpoint-defective, DNA damage sensitive protein [Pichia californica]|uniref:Lethal, checkpoint-defective, DNA damage sensitive protein n=1 Tax=Pichia californica TaxID=460514 RepID=A0A9P6WKE4_9ASCO|nr:lethal, checkpoint-defective, DNA damage sensitive protein [[Candida] californica]KAG0688705.1 lethal, checkpoint-defective, DNA damage sensitive protein [[Candida] californica]